MIDRKKNQKLDIIECYTTLHYRSNVPVYLQKIELAQSAREIERLKEELSCKDIISKSVEENLHRELNRCKVNNYNFM